jgi:hypothetical protein
MSNSARQLAAAGVEHGLEQLLERSDYRLAVSAGPVDLVALGTAFECELRLEYVGRNAALYLISWNHLQNVVAAKAASQNPGKLLGPGCVEDLPDLVLDLVAFEKNELPD